MRSQPPVNRRHDPARSGAEAVRGVAAVLVLAALAGFAAPSSVVGAGTPSGATPAPLATALLCSGDPTFSIQASPSTGVAPLSVTFTSTLSGGCPPFDIEWEFGDGAELSGATVTHVFRSAGSFPVQAQAIGVNGSGAEAFLTVVVQGGSGQLTVADQAAPPSGTAPFSTTLWANVTGGNLSSSFTTSWRFGDGGTGSGSPVSHTYLYPGTFTASALVRDSSGNSGTGNLSILVSPGGTPPGPNLSLDASPEAGGAPLAVTILAASNGLAAPDALTVCFGDSSVCATGPVGWSGSVPFAFQHTYTTAGNFTVTGTLQNTTGAVVVGATVAVSVTTGSAVVVDGTLLPASGTSPLTVSFVASISGGSAPYTVEWSFGDGAVGSSIPGTPVAHTYTRPGTFFPSVLVTDSAGHAANQTLGPVTVATGTNFAGLPASYFGIPTGILVGLALGGTAIGGILVGRFSRRRRQTELRQEGEQLVREMEQER
ncbi:MAG TPA: PKD domain-containing protein [Thermoplasmata archaeon]|nr:PKD domain-containing protein [Thermoplasmata archaeon]